MLRDVHSRLQEQLHHILPAPVGCVGEGRPFVGPPSPGDVVSAIGRRASTEEQLEDLDIEVGVVQWSVSDDVDGVWISTDVEKHLHEARRTVEGRKVKRRTTEPITILDLEASPEHLSRGTARHADVLLLVAEPYFRSLEAVRLQAGLAAETAIGRVAVVANKWGRAVRRRMRMGIYKR